MEGKIKHSLLIVDDERSNLKVLTHILGQEYNIYTATNGKSAIEKAKEYKPDLILLDIIMPDMDGYKTISEMRTHNEIKNIPVIFISGLDSDEDEERGLSLEAADYIVKPFKESIVRLRVRNQIKLKSAVKIAENANRSKSVFLAKMSHEIRTPLSAILGISAIQLQNNTYSQELRDAFGKIYSSGDLLLGIINDILDMSKIEAGKLKLKLSKYSVASLINDAVFLNMIKYEKKPVKFILNVDENVPSALFGDEVRIKQILNNLLSNAFKYTASGEVELSVSADSSLHISDTSIPLIFCVRDTGQGMTEDQINKIFDEYVRFNTEANRMIEGSGLGMNIIMDLIQMMNGKISVESMPGAGTKVTVRLPQESAGEPVLGKEIAEDLEKFRSYYEAKPEIINVDRKPIPFVKVLVVDDVDINLFVVKEILSFYGLEIDLATSGAEAIEKVKNGNYDLVFMDHLMPIMDGVETTREIRKWEEEFYRMKDEFAKAKVLPIVALTANAVSGVKDMLLANGFNDYLSKPIDLNEMDAILKKWLLR